MRATFPNIPVVVVQDFRPNEIILMAWEAVLHIPEDAELLDPEWLESE